MINRLYEPSSGEIRIDGDNIVTMSKPELRQLRMKKVSMVFQHFALFPHRTVVDNAAYGLQVQGVPRAERRKRGAEALRLVGLEGWEDSYPRQLSGGMQQRVGLARALATDADILLMDEAFSALDPLIRREMQDYLVELQRTLHKTIVFISHDLNEAMRLGDRIAVLKDGKVVQVDTPEEILTRPADDYVAAFVQDVDVTRALTASSIMRRPRGTISVADGPKVAMRKLDDLQATELYVIGRENQLVGMVRDGDLAVAARRGDRTVERVVCRKYPSAQPDTLLADLFGLATEHTIPIAVCDNGRLLGVVPRVSLLDTMNRLEGSSNATD
jgi:glycine betaine/proline transport system ATP-binding protein